MPQRYVHTFPSINSLIFYMHLESTFRIRKMGRQFAVHHINPQTKERIMIVLNDTAAFLWTKFVDLSDFTPQDLANALVEEYEIAYDIAFADVQKLLSKWKEAGIVVE